MFSSNLFQYLLSFEFVKKLILIKAAAYNSEYLKFIADQIIKKTSFCKGQKLKIFINRRECSGKTITNFKDLEKILIENNFLIIYLEDF